MKKISIIACLFITVFLVLLIISVNNDQELDIVFVDQLETENPELIKTCVKRSDGKLVLVDVTKNSDEDIYLYVLKIYDHYRNTLPLSYTSPFKGNFEVIDLRKMNDKLYIEVKTLYLEDQEFSNFLTALMWSYQGLGINTIEMKVNNEIFYLNKNEAINIEVETSSIFNNTEQVIYYTNDFEILPVTYLHDQDPVDFLMNKVLSKFDSISYTYEVVEKNLFISITDQELILSSVVTEVLLSNLEHLGIYENIVIIKNDIVVANN